MNLKGRSFLTLLDYTAEEIGGLLDLAAELKEKKKNGVPHRLCEGKNVALIFEKTSTRTRCAFEVASADLGIHPVYLDPKGSQIGKKESIADTARVLGRMFDGIEYRGFGQSRVEALARRVHRAAGGNGDNGEPDQLVSGPFVLDEKSRVLYKSGKPIDLTQVEFQIMELFFRNPGTALVREKILEGVWGKGYFGDVKIVDVNIRRLRMKIEDEPSSPQHILTVWGYGYRWNA